MTTLREAAQQALEALHGLSEDAVCQSSHHAKKDLHTSLDVCPVFLRLCAAITALRTALAQQAEPVGEPAYKVKVAGRWHEAEPLAAAFNLPDGEHLLYTAPPQRKPLTDQEIDRIRADCVLTPHEYRDRAYGWALHFARAIEKARGIE